MAGYNDGRVICTDQEIIIRHYYLAGDRTIKYSAIREVRQVPLHWIGKLRLQDSNDFIHWFNFDPRRRHKQTALVIYLDQWVRPVITPDDPAQVVAELAAHGVTVTNGHESGLI